MRSRLAASYSQARSSHLRAAVTSLRPSAASAGSIRCRSRGSTVRARASATKLVALSGRVDTSALAVRSANSRSVNAKPDCLLIILKSKCSRLPGSEAKPKAAACRGRKAPAGAFWAIHPKRGRLFTIVGNGRLGADGRETRAFPSSNEDAGSRLKPTRGGRDMAHGSYTINMEAPAGTLLAHAVEHVKSWLNKRQ